MYKQPGRIGLYLVLIVAMVAGYLFLSQQMENSEGYSKTQMEEAVKEDEVLDVRIYPNKEYPTGRVRVQLRNGDQKHFYVTDVKEVETYLEANGIDPEIADVRHFEEALDVEGLVDRAMEASRYEVIRFA